MQVKVKSFDVQMEVKSSGIEFEVRTPDGSEHIGDCYLTKTNLIWCEGRTSKANGTKMTWAQFMEVMKSTGSVNRAVLTARNFNAS
jgi:hypothetical protein